MQIQAKKYDSKQIASRGSSMELSVHAQKELGVRNLNKIEKNLERS